MCCLQSILFWIDGVREWVFETAEIDRWGGRAVSRWIEPVTWSGVSTSAGSARGCETSAAARSIRRTTSFAFGEALLVG